MRLILSRRWFKSDYTIGKLFVNNKPFCDVLEDKDRGLHQGMSEALIKKIKIPKETCIPYGTYEVRITYSNAFHKRLPLLVAVPGYKGVRIHSGNHKDHTEGCLLVGVNRERGKVLDSKIWMKKLMDILEPMYDAGEKIYIDIIKEGGGEIVKIGGE